MNKRVRLIAGGLGALVLITSIFFLIKYVAVTTIQTSELHNYCVNNSTTNASSFIRYEIASDPTYAFLVSNDTSSNLQEIFIFKKAKLGSINLPDRFSFIHQASGSLGASVGTVMFMPRDEKNKKKTTNLLVFYSSNKYGVTDYKITFYENKEQRTQTGKVSKDQAFVVSLSGLGVSDGVEKKLISAEFFDDTGKLVEVQWGK